MFKVVGSLQSKQNAGLTEQQQSYLFQTKVVIPHKTSQQANAELTRRFEHISTFANLPSHATIFRNIVSSSTPRSRCVNTQLVSLPPVGVYVLFAIFSYLFTVSLINTTVINTLDN